MHPYSPGADLPIFTDIHQALTYPDGRDIRYMREALHAIGKKYGFLDLTTSFFIEWDATMASEYDENHYRKQVKEFRLSAFGLQVSGFGVRVSGMASASRRESFGFCIYVSGFGSAARER